MTHHPHAISFNVPTHLFSQLIQAAEQQANVPQGTEDLTNSTELHPFLRMLNRVNQPPPLPVVAAQEKFKLEMSPASFKRSFLRKYEHKSLSNIAADPIEKEQLRNYLKSGNTFSNQVPLKDAFHFSTLLIDIAKESPELEKKILLFLSHAIIRGMRDKFGEELLTLRKLKLTNKENFELLAAPINYYKAFFGNITTILNHCGEHAKESFESIAFVPSVRENPLVRMNPFVMLLHSFLSEGQSSEGLSKYFDNIKTAAAEDQPSSASTAEKTISLTETSRKLIDKHNYFSKCSEMPPLELFQCAAHHKFIKKYLIDHITYLNSQRILLSEAEINTYLDHFHFPGMSDLLSRSLESKASISIEKSNSGLYSLKEKVHNDQLIQKILHQTQFQSIELTWKTYKSLITSDPNFLKNSNHISIQLPEACSSAHGSLAKIEVLELLPLINCHEIVLMGNSIDTNFIAALLNKFPSITTLNLAKVNVDEQMLLALSSQQQIQKILLPHYHTLPSLQSLKDYPNLRQVDLGQASLTHYEKVNELSQQRVARGLPAITSHCSPGALETFLKMIPDLVDFANSIKTINGLIQPESISGNFKGDVFASLSTQNYTLLLQQPRLAIHWLPFHIAHLMKIEDPLAIDALSQSLAQWKVSVEEALFPVFEPQTLQSVEKFLNKYPRILESALPFWIDFMDKVLIPNGQCGELSNRILMLIDDEAVQERLLNRILSMTPEQTPENFFMETLISRSCARKKTCIGMSAHRKIFKSSFICGRNTSADSRKGLGFSFGRIKDEIV